MTCAPRIVGLLVLWAATLACDRDVVRDPYETVTHNPIPRRNGEKALLVDSKTSAKSVLIVTTLGPTEVAAALSSGMEKRWGLDVVPPSFGADTPVRILVTKKYNVTETSDSVLRSEVYAFPGRTAERLSIVLVYRRDHWRSWGKEFHTGITVPFRTWNNTPVVTEGELTWFREQLEQRGATTAFALQSEWSSGIPNSDLLPKLYVELAGRAGASQRR